MQRRVVIVDYGTGNLSSIGRALARLGAGFVISSKVEDIESSDKLILAGVGHFNRAMKGLRDGGLIDAIEHAVRFERKPVLGICLGMELMGLSSEEGNGRGLGWLDAETVGFEISDTARFKVPHIGWGRVRQSSSSVLMADISERSEFYFLHSYVLKPSDPSIVVHEAEHEVAFPAAIEKDNIFGVQFHPEKSHRAGLQVLKNFVDIQ
jgi:glutamine amidotransferase